MSAGKISGTNANTSTVLLKAVNVRKVNQLTRDMKPNIRVGKRQQYRRYQTSTPPFEVTAIN